MLKALISILFVMYSSLGHSYEVRESMKPTNLWVKLELSQAPAHNNFKRYLSFKNIQGLYKRIEVSFVKDSYLNYLGTVTSSGLVELQTLIVKNKRSYWDSMYFENRGGSTELDIKSLKVEVEYGETTPGREEISMIAYNTSLFLNSGRDSVYLSAYSGRLAYVQGYLDISYSEFNNFPRALKYFMYDIGKSGSSGVNDSVSSSNPKYAKSGQALCSETVSWYYYTYGVRIFNEETGNNVSFKNIVSHKDMHDKFKSANRLYCYHASRKKWIKKDFDYNWVYSDTYQPRPGDFLDRKDSDGNPDNGDDGIIRSS